MIKDMAVIVLPDEVRLRECMNVEGVDNIIASEMFHAIRNNAGQERVGPGIVLMLMLALHDVCTGFPPAMFFLLKDFVKPWALAIAEGNESVQADIEAHCDVVGL